MDLLILRHGKAEDRSEDMPDDDRSLTKKGIRDIRKVSRWMARSETVPDVIVTSPLARARETAGIVARRVADREEIVLWDELGTGIAPSDVVARLGELGVFSLPLLVGHEPQLSSLIAFLIGAGTDARITLEKGGIARVGNLSPGEGGHGELQWLLTLRQLRDMA